MGFQQAVRSVFSKYGQFSDRAPRSEYWYWILFTMLATLVIGMVDLILFAKDQQLLGSLFSLAIAIPSLAVAVRRLHDVNRSGWWLLLPFILSLAAFPVLLLPLGIFGTILLSAMSFIGFVVLFVWSITRGDFGPNRFGLDPLQPRSPAEIAYATQQE